MRILVLNHNLRERGTYFRAREIARGLHGAGHEVTFLCTGEGFYRSRTRRPGPRWREIETANWAPLRDRGDGWSPLGFLQRLILARGHWDVVYTFSHKPVDQGVARLLRGRRTFWMTDWCDLWNSQRGGLHDTRFWPNPLPDTVRGGLLRASFRIEDGMEANAARDADAVSVISRPLARETRRLGIPRRRVLHLVSGADTARISVLDRTRCRALLGLKADALIAGYVANLTPDNRQLAGALERVWAVCPKLILLSAGPRWYDEYPALKQAADNGRLIDLDRVPFSRIPLVLGASDFVVMPLSKTPFNECRWPNKFGDYMAAGRATATCLVGDMGRVAEKYGVGVAAEPSEMGLANAMLELAQNEPLREACGLRARVAAEGDFSWARQLTKLTRFIEARREH